MFTTQDKHKIIKTAAKLLAGTTLYPRSHQSFASGGCSQWWGTSVVTTDKIPGLMVHGITGFDSIGGLIGYFHTIPMNLCQKRVLT